MAQDFTIEYHRTFKVLNNLRSGKTYVLRQCGTPEVIPDLPASLADATVFEVPVKKWATAGSVNMGYLAELGLASKAGAVSANYFSSPCMHKLIGCDVVTTMPPMVCEHFVQRGWDSIEGKCREGVVNESLTPSDVAKWIENQFCSTEDSFAIGGKT